MSGLTVEKTKVDVGLDHKAVDKIAAGLNAYLADLHVLYTKLHNFHWNVEGDMFYTLHENIQELYESTAEEIDDVAERVLQIGRRPLARMSDYLEAATLKETDSRSYNGREIAGTLIEDYKHLIGSLRSLISDAGEAGDEGTADDAIGWLKAREKTLWMLTAYAG